MTIRRQWRSALYLGCAVLLASGCEFNRAGLPLHADGGEPADAAVQSDAIASPDSAVVDSAVVDSAVVDSAVVDSAVVDSAVVDSAVVDSAIPDAAIPDAAIPDAAIPDAAVTCVPANCPLGCNTTLDRCNRIQPSNFDPTSFHDSITAGVSPSTTDTIYVDTDTGEIASNSVTYRPAGSPGTVHNGIYFDWVTQSGPPTLAVFGMTELDLPDQTDLVVSGSHPAAFYVTGDISLGSVVNAYAIGRAAGPGGSNGGLENGDDGGACHTGAYGHGGDQAGSGNSQLEAGGGGGGFNGAGGDGGDGSYFGTVASGGAGGVPSVSATSPLSPLGGGCGGGAGGGPDSAGNQPNDGGHGGGGGGGLQFVSGGTLSVLGTGIVDVGGGYGGGGLHGAGGGGGGAGGGILLEAATITIDGRLVTNGGGGGAGAGNLGSNGQDGDRATQDNTQAAGGNGVNYGGDGGRGGAGGIYAGGTGQTDANGGGGGGGVGHIHLRAVNTVTVNGGALVSPNNYSTAGTPTVW